MTRKVLIGVSVAALGVILLITIGGPVMLGPLERSLIYFPHRIDPAHPAPQLAHGELEEIEMVTSDGVRIYAWHLQSSNPRIATLLFFHGNGGNILYRADHIEGMARQGLDVFLVEYRGYGKSGGTPSEEGLYRDGEAAYRHLTEQLGVNPDEIVFFGESLGSAVAVEMSLRHPPAGLVMLSAFTSVQEMGQFHYPFLPSALYGILGHRYATHEKISKISVPVLLIHGTNDSIVPFEMGRQLYESAPEPRTWFPVPGADHNDVYETGGEPYFLQLAEFARRVSKNDL